MNMRDHRELIQAYDLGHIEEHSPGLIHWHPNGQKVLKKLKQIVSNLHEQYKYQEVSSPMILHRSLWEQSGHWDKYQHNMFVAQGGSDEQGQYAIKPMSCPGHISIFKHQNRSYRQLPHRLFEFGHVHRNEPSGALSGWMRLRGFVQDDSHVFAQPNQIAHVVGDLVKMVEHMYRLFGFEQWKWRLSLRPEQRSGSDELWDQAENALREVCAQLNLEVVEAPGEGAFYGPKLEAAVEDRLGRQWQCGVAQVDFVLPQQFDLGYWNDQGAKDVPVMIHHAVLGSLERWLSIVMEHHGELPDWLHPNPIVLLPISQQQSDFVASLSQQLHARGMEHIVLDDGPIQGRLREADRLAIPNRWVIGAREVEHNSVAVRRFHDPMNVVPLEKLLRS